MASIEEQAVDDSEAGELSQTSSSRPVDSSTMFFEPAADSTHDYQHPLSNKTNTSPIQLSTKATAFSIDSLIRSRDFLLNEECDDVREADALNVDCSQTEEMEVAENEDIFNDVRCSVDGDGGRDRTIVPQLLEPTKGCYFYLLELVYNANKLKVKLR